MDIVLDPQRWLVSDNEHVVAGQLLAQLVVLGETVDIVAPHAGCIEEILVPVGEPFHRGQVLARMVVF